MKNNLKEIIGNEALKTVVTSFDCPDLKLNPELKFIKWKQPVVLHENGDIELNVYFPHAKKVEIPCRTGGRMIDGKRVEDLKPFSDMGKGPTDETPGEFIEMKNLGDGWFYILIPDATPGYYYMNYWVDGIETIYEKGYISYVLQGGTNILDIPDHYDTSYLIKDVPHGSVREEFFYSDITKRWRNCFVYTPPGYDKDTDKEYPVVFFQHGGGQNETSWFWEGKLNFIMDNLLAEEKAREAILVCNTGYSFTPEDYKVDEYSSIIPGRFWDMLVLDCIPFLKNRFRIKEGSENMAVAGISMGAVQAMLTAYRYPEVFDYAGIFGMCTVVETMPFVKLNLPGWAFDIHKDMDRFNNSFDLVFFGMGESEFQFDELKRQFSLGKERGMKNIELFTCKGDHEWRAVKVIAQEFLKKIF